MLKQLKSDEIEQIQNNHKAEKDELKKQHDSKNEKLKKLEKQLFDLGSIKN